MKKLLVLLLLAYNTTSIASEGMDCAIHFHSGVVPDIKKESLEKRTHFVCYSGYALLASGLTKTPLWTAEYLTRKDVNEAANITRKDNFFAEPGIPEEDRAELSDYKRSGFDRGHMAPNGDMPSSQAAAESFSLANMIPQVGEFNGGLWREIESVVRKEAKKEGQLYIVTGPAFIPDENGEFDAINGRVLVPTHVWKAIYSPESGLAGAYWASNTKNSQYEEISLHELQKRIGIDVFPKLALKTKKTAYDLPDPKEPQAVQSTAEFERKMRGILRKMTN